MPPPRDDRFRDVLLNEGCTVAGIVLLAFAISLMLSLTILWWRS